MLELTKPSPRDGDHERSLAPFEGETGKKSDAPRALSIPRACGGRDDDGGMPCTVTITAELCATRHDLLPRVDYPSAFSNTRRERYRARSQLRPPAERGPCLHRTRRQAVKVERGDGQSAQARRTNVPLPVATTSRGRVRITETQPRRRDRGPVVGTERAGAPFPAPSHPASERSAARLPLSPENGTPFSISLFSISLPRGAPSIPRAPRTFSGGRKDGSLPRETRLITRSETTVPRPRTQLTNCRG